MFAGFDFLNYAEDPVNIAGITGKLHQTDQLSTLYVAVAKSVVDFNATYVLTNENLKENVAHELGHAVDITKGNESLGDFHNMAFWDFANLDYTAFGVDPAHSTRRDPCVGINAPFAGVKTTSGQDVCVGGVLSNSAYIGKVNSYIARALDSHIFAPADNGYFGELYAQVFAYQSYAIGLSTTSYMDFVANGVFHNSQFACTRGLASLNLGGTGGPAYCASDIGRPAWYQPYNGEP